MRRIAIVIAALTLSACAPTNQLSFDKPRESAKRSMCDNRGIANDANCEVVLIRRR